MVIWRPAQTREQTQAGHSVQRNTVLILNAQGVVVARPRRFSSPSLHLLRHRLRPSPLFLPVCPRAVRTQNERDMSADVKGGMWVSIRIPEGRGDSTSTSTMGDYDCRSLNREVYEGFCQAPSMWWDACQAGYGQM